MSPHTTSVFISRSIFATSIPISALPTLRQALRQLPSSVQITGPQPGTFPTQYTLLSLNPGPSQLNRTAGPQPGPSQLNTYHWTSTWAFTIQYAPLDPNLGPSELNTHRWTSTWDLPNSMRTAGLQAGTFPASSMRTTRPQRRNKILENMSDKIQNKILENILKKYQIKYQKIPK